MPHPWIRKLSTIAELPRDDIDLLETVTDDVRSVTAKHDIIQNGERPEFVHLMIEGWACRYQIVADGKRQITAFLLPGDLCDAHVTVFDEMDHSIGALSATRVALISREMMTELTNRPAITRALWWASLVDKAVLRAWIVNLGRRDAHGRVAHVICEAYARLLNVGLANDGLFTMPITQEDLGDALGLTPVHVNRQLKRLAEAGIMTFQRGQIEILDLDQLKKTAGFDPAYLHVTRSRQKPPVADR